MSERLDRKRVWIRPDSWRGRLWLWWHRFGARRGWWPYNLLFLDDDFVRHFNERTRVR